MAENNDTPNDPLSRELAQLRQRVSELEASETALKRAIEELGRTQGRTVWPRETNKYLANRA